MSVLARTVPTKPCTHPFNGVFAIHKRIQDTSAGTLTRLKRLLLSSKSPDTHTLPRYVDTSYFAVHGKKRSDLKVGHGGTLDPLATGVLVVGVGSGTKALPRYLDCSKEYTVTASLGSSTNTYDSEGTVDETSPYSHITRACVMEMLHKFRGPIMQRPPIFSALKRNGVPMYRLARHHQPSDQSLPILDLRPVTIHTLDLVSFDQTPESTTFSLKVECSKGTYIRSLVHDIGIALGSRAHVISLCRTRQGEWTLGMALNESEWDLCSIYSRLKWTDRTGAFIDNDQ